MIVRRARLQLTLGFTAVQLATFAAFAIGIYVYVTSAFDFDGIEDGGSVTTAEAGFAVLRVALLLGFAALVVLAPLSSWLLAGLAMRPVNATLQAQRRFVDDAAHELRTPLTAVRAHLELALLKPRTLQEYRAACASALDAAHALQETTDDLLLASGTLEERRTVELVSLGDAVFEARSLLTNPDRVDIDVVGTPFLAASATATRRLLVNLLVNACKYSPPDTAVTVRVRSGRGWGIVDISDRGVGMTRDEVAHAFDRFWQADSSRATEGNGLGLSIVHDIVTSLRGRIHIRSAPGHGTTVRVRLPLSRSSHEALRNVGSDSTSPTKGTDHGN